MCFFVELSASDPRLGGKARSLAELATRGLTTPKGFAITDRLLRALCPALPAFRSLDDEALATLDRLRAEILSAAWPEGFVADLRARLAGLGAARFCVRSSFASEDRAGQLAAGVYQSRIDVDASAVERAIREVLCSALAPGAVAYALAHGMEPAAPPVAVLVHAFHHGDAEGSAAFSPSRMDKPLVTLNTGLLPEPAHDDLCSCLRGLARDRGPVEIEWVFARGVLVYLQARAFEAPRNTEPWTGFAELGTDAATADTWHWDLAHNPLPLSPAQAGLVELADRTCLVGFRQRVLGGYLFCASDDRPRPPAIDCGSAKSYFASLQTELDDRLGKLGATPKLEDALAVFLSLYQAIFGVLQPGLREAHERLRGFLLDHAPDLLALLPALRARVPSMASERRTRAAEIAGSRTDEERRRAQARYVELFGDEAAIWDLCSPTHGENPAGLVGAALGQESPTLDWQAASARVEAVLPSDQREPWRRLLDLVRTAVALGEADDWLYARAQAAIRRALRALGADLRNRGALKDANDVFFLPLDLARALAQGKAIEADLAQEAARGRARMAEAQRHPPPLREPTDGAVVRGIGTGGRATGRVLRHRPQATGGFPREKTFEDERIVVVAQTLLPTELPLIEAAAFVTDTGGALDHVAAQARERNIPAVVGARGASNVFADGDWVLVDGDAGLVVRLVG